MRLDGAATFEHSTSVDEMSESRLYPWEDSMNVIQKAVPLTAALTLVLAASVTFAQMDAGQVQGMGNGQHMPMYDTSTVMTVKGTVQEVQQNAMQSGQMGQMNRMNHMGTHLILKGDAATYTVLVGPSSYVKAQGFDFSKGDEIEVTGSKIKYGDGDALIAREIKKGSKILTLRNEKGIPEWSMGRRP